MIALNSDFLIIFPALIVAISVHEAAHAYAAVKMGDDTPLIEGRLTLNPLSHLTLIGTLMILFAPIGWGKPVMYNPLKFHNYKWGTVITAAAGPLSNFLLAFATAFPLNRMEDFLLNYPYFYNFLIVLFQINIALLVFNLLPIPPLDGSKIIMALIPNKHHFRYEMWMNNGGIKYFVVFILADAFIASTTGFSFLSTVLGFIAIPFVALINLGM